MNGVKNVGNRVTVLFDERIDITEYNKFGFRTALDRKNSNVTHDIQPLLNWHNMIHMWSNVETEDFKLDTLRDVIIEHGVTYFYCIPCANDLDIGNPYLVQTLPLELLRKIADNNIHIFYDYTCENDRLTNKLYDTVVSMLERVNP